MREAAIVSTARTPIGKAYRGAFNDTHSVTMGGHALAQAISRAGLEPEEVQDVVFGCAMTTGVSAADVARQILVRAGVPVSAPGVTVSKFCASGLESVALGSYKVLNEGCNVVGAGGVESISLVQTPGFES